MQSAGLLCFLLLGCFLFLTYSCQADASPISNELISGSDDEPKMSVSAFLRLMDSLQDELDARREIMAATATKRGLDFGLSRGYAGSAAAKHMMGLAAANFAGGPGRRRRSAELF